MSYQPFYIGQKVIRIGKSNKYVKKGNVYTVQDCFQCPNCGSWKITIEEALCGGTFSCEECPTAIKYVSHMGGQAKNFAPVIEKFQSISLEKVLEEETKLVGVN